MKLTVAQSSVLMAICVMMLLLLADVFGLIELSIIIVTTSVVLGITAHQTLPPLDDLKRMMCRR